MSKTELEVALLSRRSKQIELLPKVKTFLDSIARNSIRSKKAYSSGLSILQNFLNAEEQKQKYQRCNCETILQPLLENKINDYELLDSFVSYVLATKPEITPRTLSLYLVAIRSYLAFYDIDVIPSKFRRKVKVPKLYKEDEEPIDASDIRKLLLNCSNRRLKSYLLILTSSGMRTVEATAIRLKDIDFSTNPTKIHVRKEYAKTKSARDVYISDEATQYLMQWIEWKQRLRSDQGRIFNPEDLVFSIYSINKEPNPCNLYVKLIYEFQKLLAAAGMAERKESGIHKRRKITLHSMRRFCKSVISNQVNQDYSEWFLGHSKSPYYTLKEPERREIYATKCMKADFFRKSEQEDVRHVSERYIAKSDPFIVMVSTPYAPDGLFDSIEKEPEESCIYKRIFMDYTYGLERIYTKEEIEKAKVSPSFEREYNLKYLGGIGNVFHTKDIDAAIEKGKLYNPTPPNTYAKKCMGIDPAYGSSSFGIVVTQFVDGQVQILHAEEYKRPDFNEMLEKVWDLLAGYNVQKIYIDGANPSFIKGLKIQWGERSDYENVKKEHRQYMKVEPVNFNQEHKEMLGQCKLYLEKGHIAINPVFDKLIISLRTAVAEENILDKECTSYSDIFDAYRLALRHYQLKTREVEDDDDLKKKKANQAQTLTTQTLS